jgi:hypothetical protein
MGHPAAFANEAKHDHMLGAQEATDLTGIPNSQAVQVIEQFYYRETLRSTR